MTSLAVLWEAGSSFARLAACRCSVVCFFFCCHCVCGEWSARGRRAGAEGAYAGDALVLAIVLFGWDEGHEPLEGLSVALQARLGRSVSGKRHEDAILLRTSRSSPMLQRVRGFSKPVGGVLSALGGCEGCEGCGGVEWAGRCCSGTVVCENALQAKISQRTSALVQGPANRPNPTQTQPPPKRRPPCALGSFINTQHQSCLGSLARPCLSLVYSHKHQAARDVIANLLPRRRVCTATPPASTLSSVLSLPVHLCRECLPIFTSPPARGPIENISLPSCHFLVVSISRSNVVAGC